MRSSDKTFFTLLLAATLASSANALTEPTAHSSAGPRRGLSDTLAAAKGSKKAAPAKAHPAEPLVVAEPAAGAALPPVPRPTVLPRENEHIERYDKAIAPL